MPLPTPFPTRTTAVMESQEWRDWSGYIAASLYEPTHEREYWAIRNSAGLIDVSPLFKYEVTGPDAARLVDRVMTRDISTSRARILRAHTRLDAHAHAQLGLAGWACTRAY